jgi:hypothetical protein
VPPGNYVRNSGFWTRTNRWCLAAAIAAKGMGVEHFELELSEHAQHVDDGLHAICPKATIHCGQAQKVRIDN